MAVYKRPNALKSEPYHRMMFCLSLYDLLGALWMVLGSIPVPEMYGIPGSVGNTEVCSAQGFFIHFSAIASNIYNAGIVVYFLLKVRYNVSDRNVTKRYGYEQAVHWSALILSLIFALIGIGFQVFNPIGFGGASNSPLCYIQAFPPGCDFSFVPEECIRGGNASSIIWYIAIGPFMITTLVLLVSLALVLHTVVQKGRATRRFNFKRATGFPTASSIPDSSTIEIPKSSAQPDANEDDDDNFADDNNLPSNSNTKHTISRSSTGEKRVKASSMELAVGKRCLVYGLVFLNTFLWTSISMIIHNQDPPSWNSFPIGCLAFIFMPIQGIFNFMIYISPRYKKIAKENGEKTKLWALYQSIFHPS